jgi:Cell wall-active antibiotics response 4TMS YvqF
MSGSDRKGVWRVGEGHWAIAVMGGCKIDLRQAVISSPVTTINAVAFWGGIEVYVPEGVEVELEGIAIMAGNEYKHVGPPPPPGAPVVRINAYACMAGVTVSDRPSFSDRVEDAVLDGLDRRQLREERRRRRGELRGR